MSDSTKDAYRVESPMHRPPARFEIEARLGDRLFPIFPPSFP